MLLQGLNKTACRILAKSCHGVSGMHQIVSWCGPTRAMITSPCMPSRRQRDLWAWGQGRWGPGVGATGIPAGVGATGLPAGVGATGIPVGIQCSHVCNCCCMLGMRLLGMLHSHFDIFVAPYLYCKLYGLAVRLHRMLSSCSYPPILTICAFKLCLYHMNVITFNPHVFHDAHTYFPAEPSKRSTLQN